MTLRQAQGERFGEAALGLFRAAAALLNWRPTEFWDSTPAELAAALGPTSTEAPAHDEIERLRALFPDEQG